MLAGLSPAGIPDFGATVAKDWRPVYRFMLADLSFAIIFYFGPTVAQDWPASLSIYDDQPMCRSVLAGLSSANISDLGPTAAEDFRSAMTASIYVGKPVFCQYHSNLDQTVA